MDAKTIVCISCYYKGYDFMDEMHKLGHRVVLITSENLQEKNWPRHAISEIYFMQEEAPSVWNLKHLVEGFAYLLRSHQIDAVVALDDYDVEKAALIRETFRISGMGTSRHHYFRDKLAMRQKALESGLHVPKFTSVFNNELVSKYLQHVPGPWVLKPRSQASASGIKKLETKDEVWSALENLENQRHLYLLESYRKGSVYHVDSLTYEGKVVFTSVSKYLAPPLDVSKGGVFRTVTLDRNCPEFKALEQENTNVIEKFGLRNGAAHTEFILGEEDQLWYFLETSSRVGGAHIADLVEESTGINLWREWARIEDSVITSTPYKIKTSTAFSAGLLIALIKEKELLKENFSSYDIVRFLPIEYHIGLVVKTKDTERTIEVLDELTEQITQHHLSVLPPK